MTAPLLFLLLTAIGGLLLMARAVAAMPKRKWQFTIDLWVDFDRPKRPGWWGTLLWEINGRPMSSWEKFAELMEHCDREITKAILGQSAFGTPSVGKRLWLWSLLRKWAHNDARMFHLP